MNINIISQEKIEEIAYKTSYLVSKGWKKVSIQETNFYIQNNCDLKYYLPYCFVWIKPGFNVEFSIPKDYYSYQYEHYWNSSIEKIDFTEKLDDAFFYQVDLDKE